jgi:uncharacterized membrane protein
MTMLDQTAGGTTSRSQTDQDGRRQGQSLQERSWQSGAEPGAQQATRNVGDGERAVSVAAGTIVALTGLRRGTLPGLLIAGVGAAMIARGVTGHCHAYQAMDLNTAEDGSEQDEMAQRGVHIAQALSINRPASELYGFWRNFENLPRIMTHLDSVRVIDERRSHWVAKVNVPGGKQLEWDAEITTDVPNELIAWRSLSGADVDNSGEVRFSPALGDRGTDVHITMNYIPPGGRVGHWIASLLGQNPKRVVREDLRNFKRLIEVGEILTIIGQPHGTCTGQGKPYTESNWKPLFT